MRRRWLRDTLIIGGVTLLLFEAGLRALPLVAPEPLGSVIRESQRIRLSNIRTYSGFSGGTRILLPPARDAGIVVVGDSVPFGTYVREADSFPSRLAALSGLVTMNLAVGSQAPPQYNRMVEIGLRYTPEWIVYGVFANDFIPDDDTVRPLSPDHPFGAEPGDRDLYLEQLDVRERAAAGLKRITNLSATYALWKLLRQPASADQSVEWSGQGMTFVFAPASYWDRLVGWDTPEVQRGVDINARLIAAAGTLAAAKSVRLLVVLLPSKEMVYGPMVGDAIYRDAHHRTYRELAARLPQVAVLDLTEDLRRLAPSGTPLFHTIDGHLNEAGHREVAARLAGRIVESSSPR